jgi:hypothetical protein
VFRMLRNVSLDAHSSAESFMTTKEHCPISFQLSLPFWPQRINNFRCFSYNASTFPYANMLQSKKIIGLEA